MDWGIEPLDMDDGFLERMRKTGGNLVSHGMNGLRDAVTAGAGIPLSKAFVSYNTPTERFEEQFNVTPGNNTLPRDLAMRTLGVTNSFMGGIPAAGVQMFDQWRGRGLRRQ